MGLVGTTNCGRTGPDVYPGFAKYYKEGYLPVPSSNLKPWNSHYTDFFDDLVDAGVLKESPHNYSSHGGGASSSQSMLSSGA